MELWSFSYPPIPSFLKANDGANFMSAVSANVNVWNDQCLSSTRVTFYVFCCRNWWNGCVECTRINIPGHSHLPGIPVVCANTGGWETLQCGVLWCGIYNNDHAPSHNISLHSTCTVPVSLEKNIRNHLGVRLCCFCHICHPQ